MTNSHRAQEKHTIQLVLTEPWDLVTAAGTGKRRAVVLETGEDQNGRPALLIELEHPFVFSGEEYKFLAVTARHDDTGLRQLKGGSNIGCNLLRLPESRATGPAPLNTSWWRGGTGAAIGDVTVE